MITQEEFCNKTNGKPWVNRAEGESAYDCWGLVVASFREVDGVELPQISGYEDKECTTEDVGDEAARLGCFLPSQARDGAIMVVYNNHDKITHVGRCLCGRVLHSTQSMGVRWDHYQSINNQFKNVRFVKYAINRT